MRIRTHRRRGSAYLLILGVAMLLTVIGVASILAVRAQREAADLTNDAVEARLYARSGIALALRRIATLPSWRTAFGEGVWVSGAALNDGTYTLEARDLGPNGDITLSSDDDPVLLIATGVKGEARHKIQVRLGPASGGAEPLTCLESALHAGGDLEFTTSTVNSGGIVSGNSDAKADGASINAAVEVVGTASGSTYSPAPTEGVDPRAMPQATVFDSYVAAGTTIAWADLPSGTIEEVLISPAANPYGSGELNEDGIYSIDCQGNDVTIQNCRIVGTLVLLNAGAGSTMTGQLRLEPAVANYPSLLVQGSLSANLNADMVLNEPQWGVNFNPTHTPLDGVGDEDAFDTHSSIVKGLVYVSGDLSTSSNVAVQGAIVVDGALTAAGELTLTYNPASFADPPPGFGCGGELEVVAGSWAQVVD